MMSAAIIYAGTKYHYLNCNGTGRYVARTVCANLARCPAAKPNTPTINASNSQSRRFFGAQRKPPYNQQVGAYLQRNQKLIVEDF